MTKIPDLDMLKSVINIYKKLPAMAKKKVAYNPEKSLILQVGIAIIVVAALFLVAYTVKVYLP